MPVKELTDAFLRTLTWTRALKDVPEAEGERPIKQITYLNRLDRGLSLVLVYSAGGTKAFRVLTYVNGKPKTRKLGIYPAMSLKEAKAQARAYFNDPQKFVAQASPNSFKEVAEEWFKRRVQARGLRSAYYLRRYLDKYIYPKWANRRFLDIKRSDVNALLDYVEDHHGASQADNVLGTIRSIMSWYQSRDDHYVSPIVKGMRSGETPSRSRILNDDEIRQLWSVTDGYPFGAFVRILLLTAQRRTKVVTMQWTDVVDGVWTIQAEPREKGNAGVLKLPTLAVNIINSQPRLLGNPYVFAGRGRVPMSAFSKRKRKLDRKLPDLPNWTLHDLRRTARSLLSRVVKPHIAERVLGHAIIGVEGIYDRHTYADEMADALERLAGLIERIVNPPADNVVQLRG